MRYLAVDYGVRRIGLAVSDETETFASPLATRERKGDKHDVAAVVDTLRGVGATGIVMGLPRGLNESEGTHEQAARRFAAALERRLRGEGLPLQIEWWDERFSTREALTHMRLAGISQRRGRESGGTDSVDARAAAVILQGYLDFRKQQSASQTTSEAGDEDDWTAAMDQT